MNRIKVKCEVTTYQDDIDPSRKKLTIRSHWSNDSKINIEIGDIEVEVVGRDLITAINNCMNCG